MTVFDHRGQKVTYQFNIAGDINIGAVKNRQEAVVQLQELIVELGKAAKARVIPVDVALDTDYHLKRRFSLLKSLKAIRRLSSNT